MRLAPSRAGMRTALTGETAVTTVLQVLLIVALAAALEPSLGAVAALACGAVALLFVEPLRTAARWITQRLFESQEQHRLRIVAELQGQFASLAEPGDLPVLLVRALREAVGLDYVSISIDEGGAAVQLASSGPAIAAASAVPVRHGAELIGTLEIADADGPISASRYAVVEAVAVHVGAALATHRLARALEAEGARLRTARADERRRLSDELHDRVGPSLAALKMGLSTRRRARSGGVAADDLAMQAREVADEVRSALHDLAPAVVSPGGLRPAVERLAGRLAAGGELAIAVRSSQDLGLLRSGVEQPVYTIVAEALNNIVRHAEATSCIVSMTRSGSTVDILVEDDGIGPPIDATPGVGLRSMRRRAALGGGVVTFAARAGGGTSLHVAVDVDLLAGG